MIIPSSAYDWVCAIKPELKKLDRIPLTGNAPPFPWDQLSERLTQSLECEGLNISPGTLAWRSKEQLLEGFGTHPYSLTFEIPSLEGEVCWIISEEEMILLSALILAKESSSINIHDSSLADSFCRFLTIEVLYNLTQIPYDQALIPALVTQGKLPDQDSLCWDIVLTLQNHTLTSRLIISPALRKSWVDHFEKQQLPPTILTEQLAKLVNVPVHLEAGKTFLTLEEWSTVQLGDFLTLDACSLDPKSLEGPILLTIHGKPAFRAKLKDGNLKILELPLIEEVETPMAKQPTEPEKEDEDEDELSDLDFSEEEDEEDEDFDEFEDDEDLFEDTEEEDLLEDEEELESDEELTSAEELETTEESQIESEEPSEEAPAPAQAVEEGPFTINQIPMALTVELGQIKLTMDQLLKLEPGNLLQLDIHPENGVDLTINGKIIGKGELIRIGEALGVRVLQLP